MMKKSSMKTAPNGKIPPISIVNGADMCRLQRDLTQDLVRAYRRLLQLLFETEESPSEHQGHLRRSRIAPMGDATSDPGGAVGGNNFVDRVGAPGGEENRTKAEGAQRRAGVWGRTSGRKARGAGGSHETRNHMQTSATIVPKGTAPDEPRPQIRRLRMKKTQKMMPGYSSAVARVSVFHCEPRSALYE